MSRPVAVVGLAAVILGILLVPIAAVPGDAASPTALSSPTDAHTSGYANPPAPAFDQPALLQSAPGEFDRTLFDIRVFENGSARWTFQYTRLLENDTETSDFEGYAADFRTNETDLYRQFLDQAEGLARAGSNVTERSMTAESFSRDARVGPLGNKGLVEMSFTWTNFGQQRESGGVLVSDVFEGGLAIRSQQRLRFVAGPNLAFETVDPSPTNTSEPTLVDSDWIAWVGERSFGDEQPAVAFQPASAVRTTTASVTTAGDSGTATTDSGETTADDTGPTTAGGPDGTDRTTATGSDSSGIGMLVSIAALALVALGILAAAWLNGVFEPGDSGEVVSDDDGPPASSAPTPSDEADEMGTALLSDEDRVTQLLEDNGGRMKQTEIVDATEWSKSKVSMLLSEMEDDDQITKLRVGRENIISLPGDEPAAAGSPFDDEE